MDATLSKRNVLRERDETGMSRDTRYTATVNSTQSHLCGRCPNVFIETETEPFNCCGVTLTPSSIICMGPLMSLLWQRLLTKDGSWRWRSLPLIQPTLSKGSFTLERKRMRKKFFSFICHCCCHSILLHCSTSSDYNVIHSWRNGRCVVVFHHFLCDLHNVHNDI